MWEDTPDIVRIIYHMAGNERRAKVIFWIVAVLGIGVLFFTLVLTAWNALELIIQTVANMPTLKAFLISVVSALLFLVVVMIFALAGGGFIGELIRTGLMIPTRKNISILLDDMVDILHQANKVVRKSEKEKIGDLLLRAEGHRYEWNTSRLVRFINWLIGRRVKQKITAKQAHLFKENGNE